MDKIINGNIEDLKFDQHNCNDHCEFGSSLLVKSLQELGAGRSILLDVNNNIVAGNGITEAAASIGIENIKIVETDGNTLVAVKRTDLDINTPRGRKMAFVDNATAAADLSWNDNELQALNEEFDVTAWGVDLPDIEDLPTEDEEDTGGDRIAAHVYFKRDEDLQRFIFKYGETIENEFGAEIKA